MYFCLLSIDMAKSNVLRDLAISHFKSGKKPYQIYEIINKQATLRTVYNWISYMKKNYRTHNLKSPGRPRTVRTPANLAKSFFGNEP